MRAKFAVFASVVGMILWDGFLSDCPPLICGGVRREQTPDTQGHRHENRVAESLTRSSIST